MAFDVTSIGAELDPRPAEDIATDAIAKLQESLPDWIARNASVEVVLIEALALAAAEITTTGNNVIGAVTEAILSTLYQVERSAGTNATGTLTVTFDSTVSTTIPQGTAFVIADYNIEVQATADVTVSSATTAAVAVSTTTPSAWLNGVSSSAVDILDYIPNALSVAITTAFSGGSEPEDDNAYIARARNRLARVTSSLVVPGHFTSYVLEDGRASNATTIGAWNGSSIGTAGTDAGHVTTVTYGKGAQLSSTVRSDLASKMQEITAAGATVHVVDASLNTVAVTVTVKALAGTDTASIKSAIEAALKEYLNPETWVFGETVRTTSLTTLIENITGIDYVDSLSAPASNVTLTANQVAKYGTLLVTVT